MSKEQGKVFPAPMEAAREFSGRITLRVPKHLHATLDSLARADDVSLNTWLVSALSAKAVERITASTPMYTVATGAFTSGAQYIVHLDLSEGRAQLATGKGAAGMELSGRIVAAGSTLQQ
jgi:hypothetical protein